jgi:hypothetical protein
MKIKNKENWLAALTIIGFVLLIAWAQSRDYPVPAVSYVDNYSNK